MLPTKPRHPMLNARLAKTKLSELEAKQGDWPTVEPGQVKFAGPTCAATVFLESKDVTSV